MKLTSLLLLCLAWVSSPALTQVIRVPSQQPTIQKALDSARPGTTVLVDPGTYPENLVWPAVDGIRLIAVEGPDHTVLAATGAKPGVDFGSGLTRTTVLQGLAIQGGGIASGPGVRVASSPTLRFNEIRGFKNAGQGGGLVIVNGGRPMIDRNTIEWNESTVAGAGIFVGGGARPVIRGNLILANMCLVKGQPAYGAGIHVNSDAGAGILITGNVIAGNLIPFSSPSGGAGIAVMGGATDVVNNTIVGNRLSWAPTGWPGGAVYLAGGLPGSHHLFNNIVAGNEASGFCAARGQNPVLDFNHVWMNRYGDYVNVTRGQNAAWGDPGFAGPGDYHLSPTSILVDAGGNVPSAAQGEIDIDGDPRFLDGRLGTPHARADIGADELNPVRLLAASAPAPGRSVSYRVEGPAGGQFALFVGTRRASLLMQPFGQLLIQPLVVVGVGATPGGLQVTIPTSPALEGTELLTQALVARTTPSGVAGAFTNRLDQVVATRVQAIEERFDSTWFKDAASTTASWGAGLGGAGLTATYGYGGDGSDGDFDLANGRQVLDSSTRAPGSDGVVEWNFKSLTVQVGATLELRGPHPIRLNVLGRCSVDGAILLSGQNGLNAPPGSAGQVGRLAGGRGGPGGGRGGDANTNPKGSIGALPMELRGGPGWPPVVSVCGEPNRSANRPISPFEPNCGGGTGGNRGLPLGTLLRNGCSGNGGGHVTDGFPTDNLCSNWQANGAYYGEDWVVATGAGAIQLPSAGTGGGAGGNATFSLSQPVPANDIVAGSGGGAGGGLEIVALESLDVSGTIDANGGNGGMGWTTVVGGTTVHAGWGGGGAGGSIWLSGTSVTVGRTARLTAVGGVGNPNPPNPSWSGAGGFGYIVVRDRGGDPGTWPAHIVPAPVAGRMLFDPLGNGKSEAVSLFHDSGTAGPMWTFDANDPKTGEVKSGTDLGFHVPPAPGQKVFVEFQGAPDQNGKPDPNPANWFPLGGFTPDAKALRGKGLRHLRFRIRFELGKRLKGQAPPSRVVVKRIRVRY